jgi:hypothetical protein
MSVRKRTWFTRKQIREIKPRAEALAKVAGKSDWLEYRDQVTALLGIEPQLMWLVDYRDGNGKRRFKTFDKKKDADQYDARSRVEVIDGTHVADSASVTVKEAGELWLKSAEANNLEWTTIEQYRQHLNLHILPFLGTTELSKLSAPVVRAFTDRLQENGRSLTLTKYVKRSLGSLLADAQERALRFVIRFTRSGRNGRRLKRETHAEASSRSVSIFRRPTKSKALFMPPGGDGARSFSPQYSPDCAPPNCAVCVGKISISRKPSCTSASAPIGVA